MIGALVCMNLVSTPVLPEPYPALLAAGGVKDYELDSREVGKSFNGFTLKDRTKGSPLYSVEVDLFPKMPANIDPRHAFDWNKGKPNKRGLFSTAGVSDWKKPHFTPSKDPLGHDLFVSSGGGMVWILASSSHGSVDVHVRDRWSGEGRRNRDQLAERLARWALGNLIGDRLNPDLVSKKSFVDSAGASYLLATDWAAKNGYRVDFNRDAGRMAIKTPKGKLTLFIGSDRAKLGNSWLEMPEVLPCRGKNVLIPARLVEKLDRS